MISGAIWNYAPSPLIVREGVAAAEDVHGRSPGALVMLQGNHQCADSSNDAGEQACFEQVGAVKGGRFLPLSWG